MVAPASILAFLAAGWLVLVAVFLAIVAVVAAFRWRWYSRLFGPAVQEFDRDLRWTGAQTPQDQRRLQQRTRPSA